MVRNSTSHATETELIEKTIREVAMARASLAKMATTKRQKQIDKNKEKGGPTTSRGNQATQEIEKQNMIIQKTAVIIKESGSRTIIENYKKQVTANKREKNKSE